jgi:hypothetical protein
MKSSVAFSVINCINGKNYKIGYGDRKYSSSVILIIAFLFSFQINVFSQEFFNYSLYLFDPPSSLSLNIEEINRTTGYVRVNGYVSGGPTFIRSISIATLHKITFLELLHIFQAEEKKKPKRLSVLFHRPFYR